MLALVHHFSEMTADDNSRREQMTENASNAQSFIRSTGVLFCSSKMWQSSTQVVRNDSTKPTLATNAIAVYW